MGDRPPWTGGMVLVGVNDFSSNFVLRLLSETILNISPITPLPDLWGMTSVIRFADVLWCTYIVWG